MTVQIKVWTALLASKRAIVGGPDGGFVGSAVGLDHRYVLWRLHKSPLLCVP